MWGAVANMESEEMAPATHESSSHQTAVRRVPPYVGLRPYEEDERELFFGRDRDARLLRNEIFSGPLTLLYAPSGVGKTSLLRTQVIPDLRAQGAHVVYFDRWAERDPCAAVKSAVQESVDNVPAAATGTPDTPLAEV